MKVSLVVPVYKKTFDQVNAALNTLKTQSHKDIEVVVVFDGPDADLETSIKSGFESDSRFSFHVIEHGGAPKARNAGFALSTGDVVAFWDADCYAEPEMVKMWVKTFEMHPEADFVYSGYKWTDPKMAGFDSEKFDPWLLKQYNFICSMFPIKWEEFFGWDEALEGLQDWDYWRRAVDAGCVGQYIPGYGFATDLPDDKSISGNADRTRARVAKIREKFGDPQRDILVYGGLYKNEAIHIAKVLDADYFLNWPFYKIHDYKMVLMVGFHPWELKGAASLFSAIKNEKKVIYWMGQDAEITNCAPYHEAKTLISKIKEDVKKSFCDGERTRKILESMEIEAEILLFPSEFGTAAKTMPEKFKVLALADANFKEHLLSVVRALPMVKIDVANAETPYDIADYSVGIQLTEYPRLLLNSQKMIMNGRHMISNVQEPYSGYVQTEDITKFKTEMISKILEFEKTNVLNTEGAEYYLQTTDQQTFTNRVRSEIAPVLEVVQ